jgi:hypothetical protein
MSRTGVYYTVSAAILWAAIWIATAIAITRAPSRR